MITKHEKRRLVLDLLLLGVLALLFVSSLVWAAQPHPPSLTPSAIVSPAAFAQLTSTANENLKRVTVFHQNNSGVFGGSSTIATFPNNFTSNLYSSIGSFVESFTVTTSNGYFPQVNFTQGSTVVTNATVSLPFTLQPPAFAPALKMRVVETYSSQAALPGNGAYTITSLASQAIIFSLNTQFNWTQSASAFAGTYTLSAPTGYQLNSSQVFLPFPATANVNYSTVNVTVNGTSIHTFQVQTGGVYVNWAALGAGYNATIRVGFQSLPTITGVAPVLTASGYALLNQTYFQLNVSWSNTLGNTYAGVFLIVANFSGQLNPATITVINGNRLLPSGASYLTGNTLTILPQVVTVPVAGTVSFYVDFQFYGAPPRYTINSATPCLTLGASVLTCGALTGAGALLMPVVLLVGWLSDTRLSRNADVRMFTREAFRNNPRFTYSVVFLMLVFAAAYLLLQVI